MKDLYIWEDFNQLFPLRLLEFAANILQANGIVLEGNSILEKQELFNNKWKEHAVAFTNQYSKELESSILKPVWHNSNEEQPDGKRRTVCYCLNTNGGEVGIHTIINPNYRWAYLEDLDPEYGDRMKTIDTVRFYHSCM